MTKLRLTTPSRRLVSTSDLDEVHRVISPLIESPRFSFLEGPRSTHFEVNRLELPRSQIFGVTTKSSVRVVVEKLSAIQVTIPLQGEIRATQGQRQLRVSPGSALVQFAGESQDLVRVGACTTVFIHVHPKFFEQYLPDLQQGQEWQARLESHVLGLDSGLGKTLSNLVIQICREARQWNADRLHDCDAESVLHYLLGLIFVRNAYVELSNPGSEMKPPRYLDRTIAFINENLESELSLSDLTAVAHVSTRTLQRAFKDRFGMSPIKYVKRARLNKVREELLNTTPYETSVSQTAARWGFYHGGNFARDYWELFGEKPGVTLRSR